MMTVRDGKPFCDSCKEFPKDVIQHLRQHGVYIPSFITAPPAPSLKKRRREKPKPCPTEVLDHEKMLGGLLNKVASSPHAISYCQEQCTCNECKTLYGEVNNWYVQYDQLKRKYAYQ